VEAAASVPPQPSIFDRDQVPPEYNLETLGKQVSEITSALVNRLSEFVHQVQTLEVRSYVTEDLGTDVEPFTGAREYAVTRIELDGDTQTVISVELATLEDVMWDVHTRAVEQAQANRAAMLKAVGELLSTLAPTGA
jgi:hypothetical protein